MNQFFRSLFCCGRRDRPPNSEEPDERTQLLASRDESQSVSNYAADPHELRERMGSIVRAKEGKMVNVNAQLPFNMHIDAPHSQLHNHSGRHFSVSQDDLVPGMSAVVAESDSNSKRSAAGVLSYPVSRDLSPSHTSPSSSSLHPGDASYLPPEIPAGEQPRPHFNMRIVPSATEFTGGPGTLFRGRSSTTRRLSHSVAEDRPTLTPTSVDLSHKRNVASNVARGTVSGAHAVPSGESTQNLLSGTNNPCNELSYTPEFRIQDVGKISQSWGD
ncbi:hypothetical protein OBBRIDRAFT_827987 [Obba rivulosa]|uniref:Uncharacterized protein n=1 Tax=Obba rivulosa TaxID=1052685 RepID=A0A8E2DLK9_9APHY|nr:hypothetical protein OBBRIDRAFT_827987 [Obba rivulosa]